MSATSKNHRSKDHRSKEHRRRGTWAHVETFEDPDSHIALVLYERVKGRPGYSFQLGHFDAMGFNKHIPAEPKGAKHPVPWIVKSLVDRAYEAIQSRKSRKQDEA